MTLGSGGHRLHITPAGSCAVCKLPLLENDPPRSSHCSRPACVTRQRMAQAAEIAAQVTARRDLRLAQTEARAKDALDQAIADLGLEREDIAVGLAPHIILPEVPLPDSRKESVLAHVAGIVAESFARHETPPGPPDTDPDYEGRITGEQPEPAVWDATCIACRGDCCLQGAKTNAFLETATIDYVRWRNPDLSPEEIVALYAAHMPERSIRDSCVYHTDTGCVLRREIRADICNEFQCPYRRKIAEAHAESPGNGTIVAGVSEDHQNHPEAGGSYLKVVSVSEDGTIRVHEDLRLTALE